MTADRIAELEREIGRADDLYRCCQSGHRALFKDRADDLRAELSRLRNEQPAVTDSSGNVFVDLGVAPSPATSPGPQDVRARISHVLDNLNSFGLHSEKIDAILAALALASAQQEPARPADNGVTEIYRKALDRISKSNLSDMGTLHPDSCPRVAAEALRAAALRQVQRERRGKMSECECWEPNIVSDGKGCRCDRCGLPPRTDDPEILRERIAELEKRIGELEVERDLLKRGAEAWRPMTEGLEQALTAEHQRREELERELDKCQQAT